MHTGPADAVRERIRTQGPITFATFMEFALYGPGGFYETPPVGARGDFVTSPHVHPAFGVFVARALEQLGAALDGDGPLRLAEVGAGDGTLARQILGTGGDPGFAYTAVEVSPGARRALAAIEGLDVAERLHPPNDLVLAHELLDNLPFRLIRHGLEVRVGLGERDELVERPTEIDAELRDLLGGADVAGELVVPVGAFAFVDELRAALEIGYALLIDYGADDGSGGPAHGYQEHHVVEDLLGEPGATDITAGVDFGWIARHAAARGFQAFGTVRQQDALIALGFEPWFHEELAIQQQQLAGGQGIEAVRTWSMRSRATMLVDPGALGRMRWLVLATPGLPEPAWSRAPHDLRRG